MPSLADLRVYSLTLRRPGCCAGSICAANTMSKSQSSEDDGEIVPVNVTDHVADALLSSPAETSRASLPGECFQPQRGITYRLHYSRHSTPMHRMLSFVGDIRFRVGRLNKIERLSKRRRSTKCAAWRGSTMTDEEQLERVKRAVTTLSTDLPVQRNMSRRFLSQLETRR
jgi:hypothetical protein